MRNRFPWLVLGTILCLAAVPAAALSQPVQEREPNDHLATPQALSLTAETVRVESAMGEVNGAALVDDVDFFKVFLTAGDVVTVAVENGLGGAQSVRLFLAVFKPVPEAFGIQTLDAPPSYEVDRVASATVSADPVIENYVVAESGAYVIGVCSYPRSFNPDGTVRNAFWNANGDYNLAVSGVSPSALQVPIAVKPGSSDLAPFNPKAQGRLPVALLSTPDFSPLLDVDLGSLRFGATGQEESLLSCQGDKGRDGPQGEDLNGDGIPDLVCHFDRPACGFGRGTLEGILTGTTRAGQSFEGRGWLKIVPPGG